MSATAATPQRTVLRKAAAAPAAPATAEAKVTAAAGAEGPENEGAGRPQGTGPRCLLDGTTWQLLPQEAAQLLTSNQDFSVVGVLGRQGLGKSSFLNRLLGCHGAHTAAAPPAPGFAVGPAAEPWRHRTSGVMLAASPDRLLALDTQPLFSASVLADMAACWQAPPGALAAPAVAAAGEGKAGAVPFEGAQALAQLQLAVLLLSACHRVLVFCDGWADPRAWEFLQTAEMLARGVPDPSLPPPEQQPPQQGAATPALGAGGAAAAAAGGGGAGGAGQAAAARQPPPPQEHLAEVVLVHVVDQAAPPAADQLQQLERRLDAFFAGSRLRRPGALRMLQHQACCSGGSRQSGAGGAAEELVGYWVLPAQAGGCQADAPAWDELAAALLARPGPPFARRGCSELQWLKGVEAESWRAVRRSVDIATFYSRLARTQLKGGGGWALAR